MSMSPPSVINDKIMNVDKGWIVVYKDGSVVVEGEIPWRQVVKRNIKSLTLKWYDKFWTVSDKRDYVCFSRKSAVLSSGGSYTELESRCVGFYDETTGDKIIYQVNETTGLMKLVVKSG